MDPSGRELAMFVYAPDGRLLVDAPSGFFDQTDPPPRLPPIPGPAVERLVDRMTTLPAVDESLQYRVLVRRGARGEIMVFAGSLRQVDETVSSVVQTMLAAGLVTLLVGAGLSFLLIRRGLEPVNEMIDTAAAIADGDLSRRVPRADGATELGRLGAALNHMLAQIEAGIRERTEHQERLRRFVDDAAHELRTPLTSLRGYVDLYQQGALPTASDVGMAMRRIGGEGARMARLVDELLLLARLDRQPTLEKAEVDLTGLARDAVDDFRVLQPDRPITTDLTERAVILGDRLRLRQVVDNLLANVRVHTPSDTAVTARTSRDAGHVELVVADRGPGIPPEDLERVFERFWRADPSRERRTGGSGLGLAIVASIVQAHDGSVQVTSAPGEGTTFTVRLPLAPRDPTPQPPPHPDGEEERRPTPPRPLAGEGVGGPWG